LVIAILIDFGEVTFDYEIIICIVILLQVLLISIQVGSFIERIDHGGRLAGGLSNSIIRPRLPAIFPISFQRRLIHLVIHHLFRLRSILIFYFFKIRQNKTREKSLFVCKCKEQY